MALTIAIGQVWQHDRFWRSAHFELTAEVVEGYWRLIHLMFIPNPWELNKTMLTSALLTKYWPHEANVVGQQYVDIISREAEAGRQDIASLFEKTEGEHAYGILEAIDTLIASATLLVACLQLRQATKSTEEAKAEILKKLSESLPGSKAEELTKRIISGDE